MIPTFYSMILSHTKFLIRNSGRQTKVYFEQRKNFILQIIFHTERYPPLNIYKIAIMYTAKLRTGFHAKTRSVFKSFLPR